MAEEVRGGGVIRIEFEANLQNKGCVYA